MQFKEFWEWTFWFASYLDVEFCVGSMKNLNYSCFELFQITDQTKRTNLILNSLLSISV